MKEIIQRHVLVLTDVFIKGVIRMPFFGCFSNLHINSEIILNPIFIYLSKHHQMTKLWERLNIYKNKYLNINDYIIRKKNEYFHFTCNFSYNFGIRFTCIIKYQIKYLFTDLMYMFLRFSTYIELASKDRCDMVRM
jgi:hypothetical protein